MDKTPQKLIIKQRTPSDISPTHCRIQSHELPGAIAPIGTVNKIVNALIHPSKTLTRRPTKLFEELTPSQTSLDSENSSNEANVQGVSQHESHAAKQSLDVTQHSNSINRSPSLSSTFSNTSNSVQTLEALTDQIHGLFTTLSKKYKIKLNTNVKKRKHIQAKLNEQTFKSKKKILKMDSDINSLVNEKSNFVSQIKVLKEENATLNTQLTQLNGSIELNEQVIEDKTRECTEIKQVQQHLQEQLSQAHENCSRLEQTLVERDTLIASLHNHIECSAKSGLQLKSRKVALENELKERERNQKECDAEIDSLKQTLQVATTKFSTIQKELLTLEEQFDQVQCSNAEKDAVIQHLNQFKLDSVKTQSEVRETILAYETELESKTIAIERLHQQLKESSARQEELEEKLTKHCTEKDTLSEANIELSNRIDSLVQELIDITNQSCNKTTTMNNLTSKLAYPVRHLAATKIQHWVLRCLRYFQAKNVPTMPTTQIVDEDSQNTQDSFDDDDGHVPLMAEDDESNSGGNEVDATSISNSDEKGNTNSSSNSNDNQNINSSSNSTDNQNTNSKHILNQPPDHISETTTSQSSNNAEPNCSPKRKRSLSFRDQTTQTYAPRKRQRKRYKYTNSPTPASRETPYQELVLDTIEAYPKGASLYRLKSVIYGSTPSKREKSYLKRGLNILKNRDRIYSPKYHPFTYKARKKKNAE